MKVRSSLSTFQGKYRTKPLQHNAVLSVVTVKQEVVYESWNVGKREISSAHFILTNRPNYVKAIFKFKPARIGQGKTSLSVRTVANALAKEIENLTSSLPTTRAVESDY